MFPRGCDHCDGSVSPHGRRRDLQVCSTVTFRGFWWHDGGLFLDLFRAYCHVVLNEGLSSGGLSGGLCGFCWEGGWHRGWEEKKTRPMEFKLCSLLLFPFHVFEQTRIFVSHVLYYKFLYKQSLKCPKVFPVCDSVGMSWVRCVWGARHWCVTDWNQCVGIGSGTRRVVFYVSLDGAGLRPSGPSSGSTGGVRMSCDIRVREHCTPDKCIFIYIVYRKRNCKLVGEWRTSIRELSEMWGGDRRDAGSGRDCHESTSARH